MGLTRLAIHRPLAVLMALLGVVLMGAVSYTYLKVDRLPPISIPFVSVSVSYPQASAADVEQLVTIPIENAVSGIEGVQQISSNSSEGRANVNIQMVEGADANTASIEVARRLASLRNRLPADAGEPTVNRADPNSSPIMNIALTGAALDTLYSLANDQFQPALQSVVGVASVTVSGGLQREIRLSVDFSKLTAYGITIQQVSQAIQQANVTSPAGSLSIAGTSQDIRTVGRFESAKELENVVVATTSTGSAIFVRDVATLKDGYKEQTQFQRMNGQDAVGLTIVKQSGANALQVADDVRAIVEKLKPILPAGTNVKITNDASRFTRSALEAIQQDLGIAMLLVGAVMLLFLHDWKHTIIVLLAIPTSMISTFLVMYIMGFTLNLVTLMALALMIGILVDDSIVVLENIHRHLLQGKNPWQAALEGRNEIALAAIAITMADVVVYAPIGFLQGTVGQIFRQYALTVVVATLFSLLVGFTLTPMLASRWMDHDKETHSRSPLAAFGRWWDRGFLALGRAVGRFVPWVVRLRWLVVLVSISLVAGAGTLVANKVIGQEYSPSEDDSQFQVNVSAPPGTSIQRIDEAARQMESALQNTPEVVDVFANVSAGGTGGFGGGGARASFTVQTVPKSERNRSVSDITQDIRAFGRTLPGVNVNAEISSPLGDGFGRGGIGIQVRGPEADGVQQVADMVIEATRDVPGLAELRANTQAGTPEMRIVVDQARMAQLGVNAQTVATTVRTLIGGTTVTQLRPTGKPQQDVTLIASDKDRKNLNDFNTILIAGAGQGTTANPVVTLGQVATITRGTGPTTIQRVDRNRTLSLSATISNRPLGDVADDIKKILKDLPLPAGYSVNVGGGVNQLNAAIAALSQALVLSLVLEYMLLVALYESWFYPLVRMCAVPLGLVGAFAALYLTGNTINIFSIIGMIMAEGLVAKNGILLIDYTNQLRERGMGRLEALSEAARVRLRPILMTSATLIFGLMPLALKIGEGGESRAPTAVVVIGAVLSSTLLTFGAIPAIYTLFDDLQDWFTSRRKAGLPRVPATLVPVVSGPHQPVGVAQPSNGAHVSAGTESRTGGSH